MKETPIFKPADYFLIRAPLLPLDIFFNKLAKVDGFEDLVHLYHSYSIVQEAILVANPKLFYLLENAESLNESKKKQVSKTLLNYFLRLTSRPTPFGLFASVGTGSFSSLSKVSIPKYDELLKHLRPDIEWYFKSYKKIEKESQFLTQLKIIKHNALGISGGRIYNYGYWDHEKETYLTISIKYSEITAFILKNASDWIKYEQLEAALFKKFSNIDTADLSSILKQLFQKQFLISSLNPDLLRAPSTPNFLDHLLLNETEIHSQVNDLSSAIKKYNSGFKKTDFSLLKKSRYLLETLLEKDQINHEMNSIQLDTAFPKSQLTLHTNISNEATKVASFLYHWSCSQLREKQIHVYHRLFLEKYGTEKYVPFLQLIDPHLGLGIPDFELDANYEQVLSSFGKNILNSCEQAIFRNEQEVTISEEQLKKFTSDNSRNLLPPISGSILCEVIADNQKAIDRGDFNLNLSPGQVHGRATSIIGRFTHILPEEMNQNIIKTHLLEEELEKNAIFSELSWLPHLGKFANVAIHKCFRNSSLKIPNTENISDTTSSLSLEDLYVGCNSEHLFIISKKNNARVIFSSNNVLNQELAPPIVQLLYQISQCSNTPFVNFSLQSYHLPYLPRVKYSKTYLLPATWNIQLDYFKEQKPDQKQLLREGVKFWMDEWRVPRFVYINNNYSDQRLLLDRENPFHLEQAIKLLEKEEHITLFEKISINESKWAKGILGSYLCELAIPFTRQQISNFTLPSSKGLFTPESSSYLKKIQKKWLYLKLYVDLDRQDNLLINHILPFMQQVGSQEWFYIRYKDSAEHIRLRIKIVPNTANNILLQIHNWVLDLLQQGFISNSSYHIYYPEIERYGGVGLIELAEKIFMADSLTAIAQLFQNRNSTVPLSAVAAIGIVDFLFSFDLTLDQCCSLLTINPSEKNLDLSGFRKNKTWLLEACQVLMKPLFENPKSVKTLDPLKFRSNNILKYKDKAHILFAPLTDKGCRVIDSFIHMYCNRLGIFPNEEKKVLLYAFKTISTLLMKKTRLEASIKSS